MPVVSLAARRRHARVSDPHLVETRSTGTVEKETWRRIKVYLQTWSDANFNLISHSKFANAVSR